MRWVILLLLGLTRCGWAQEPELVLATGHRAAVTAVAVSPDASLYATAGEDGTARLWDAERRRVIATLVLERPSDTDAFYTPPLTSVAFNQDGRLLATADAYQRVALWDVAQARLVTGFDVGPGKSHPTLVAFRPGGSQLVTAGKGQPVSLWEGGPPKWSLDLGEVRSLDLCGDLLAVGDSRGMIHLVDLAAGSVLKTLESPSPVEGLAFSPDGTRVAAAGRSGITILDLAGAAIERLERPLFKPRLLWLSDGLWVAGSRDGQPRLFRVAPELVLLDSEREPVGALAGAGTRMVAGRPDGSATVFQDGRLAGDLLGTVSTLRRLLIAGKELYTAGEGPRMTRWSLDSGRITRVYEGPSDHATGLAVAEGLAALCDYGGRLRVWNAATGEVLCKAGASPGTLALEFSPSSGLLACAGQSGDIELLDPRTGAGRTVLRGDGVPIHALAFRPDGAVLSVGDALGRVVDWELPTQRKLRTRSWGSNAARIKSLDYSPDGKFLAAGAVDGVLRLMEGEGDPVPVDAHYGPIEAVRFSPDGSVLATGGANEQIKLFDPTTRQEKATLSGHRGALADLAFTPSGEVLVSCAEDGTLRFWQNHRPLATALVLGEGDWVVTTPEGLFDGSPRGRELIDWRLGDRLFALEQFFNTYHVPGLLGRLLKPSLESELPRVDLGGQRILAPPRVRIKNPAPGQAVASDSVTVEVAVLDQGGGASEPALYVNGHRLPSSRARRGQADSYLFETPLVSGVNTLQATAFNQDRSLESRPDRIRITSSSPARRQPVLHLLAVGLDKYSSGLTLNFAAEDARSIAGHFSPGLFAQVKARTLLDQEATKSRILHELGRLEAEALPHDAVLIYLAGHGTLLGELYYFLPFDAGVDTDQAVRASGLSSAELSEALTRIPATKQLIVLDSCHSGAAAPVLGKYLASRDALGLVRAQQRLARASGTFLVAASTAQQQAKELPELGHGVLTYSLLTGLSASGADRAPDGTITVNSLLNYITHQVPRLTEQYHGGAQNIVQFSTGQDFPLIRP